ncbi:PKD domain-containing protein [Cellulomonas soli]|uniref:PKD domain-containing protein n=1 Tax=Cellulomonas soli TaxID=931535 RepID=A0A512PFD4_9CELL|nr:PKD domain-containing protein [Cellulomonas soli]NYI59305.1 hypothetical protein [Cellulomonas soli]GEP69907.1 hypothetical protein CSO01_26220 [Cellulomonas soli]
MRDPMRLVFAILLGAVLLMLDATTGFASDDSGAYSARGYAHDDVVTMQNGQVRRDELAAAANPAASPWEYARIAHCGMETWIVPDDQTLTTCMGTPIACENDATPYAPLYRRPTGSTDDSTWERIGDWTCPEVTVPAFTAQDLRNLLIVSGTAGLQPGDGALLVNHPNIVYTDATDQAFTTTLLGFTFDVTVTATTFTWDFDDGTPTLSTTDPGTAYRTSSGDDLDGYLTHTYTQPGTHAMTLTTTWAGRYRVQGDTDWQDVLGTATTTASSRTFDVVERQADLVADDCDADPTAPGCG